MINFLPGKSLMKFDRQLPFYNWLYPVKGQELDTVSHHEFHVRIQNEGVRSRALYFHVPFCDTICTFCTLNRGLGSTGDEQIEAYLQALLKEVALKGKYAEATSIPIRAIFFGGGTPTTLSADQIRRLGQAMHDHFDLTELQEFTFECEVKSVTEAKCAAMRDIGVNKVRFGLQSFDPLYRELFNITATIDQEHAAVEMFSRYFEYTSFDMIYGMHGQTFEQFSRDIEYATSMGTATMELYPISNVATQARLHHAYAARGLKPLSFIEKMAMTIYLNQYMRASGFQQHNGHGFLRLPEGRKAGPHFISRDYLNLYNMHTWSHYDDELIGLGNSAISQVANYTVMNDDNRSTYVKNLLENNDVKIKLTVGDGIPYERGIVLHLPYFGRMEKSRISWEYISPEITDKLGQLVSEGMLEEDSKEFRITELGWIWYVNMMYYLSPASDQKVLDEFTARKRRTRGLTDGDDRMLPLLPTGGA